MALQPTTLCAGTTVSIVAASDGVVGRIVGSVRSVCDQLTFVVGGVGRTEQQTRLATMMNAKSALTAL